MSDTRLFLRAPQADAEAVFAEFERIFEDDGFALSINEIDERTALHEVSVYVTGDPSGVAERMREAARSVSRPVEIDRETLPDIDWVSLSLECLTPVRAGRVVVHGSHSKDELRHGDLPVLIEASQAFGTGHHGTTWGCLTMIQQLLKREKPANALDLGTGTGLLAIAIAKLARIPVLATDIDPVATRLARQNVIFNGAAPLVRTITATGFRHEEIRRSSPYDLIVANILARPLMALAPQMKRHLAVGGSVILSGILDRQRRQVVSAYAGAGFRHVRTLTREGWVTIHMK